MSTSLGNPFEMANEKLRTKWREYRRAGNLSKLMEEEKPLDLWPVQYPTPDPKKRKNYVLFIGINPSARPSSIPTVKIRGDEDISADNAIRIIDFEENERGEETNNPTFFSPLQHIADGIDASMIDIDVFALRMTSSNNVRELMSQTKYSDYFKDQFIIFNELLENVLKLMPPKGIVMNNATASRLLFGEYGEMPGVGIKRIRLLPSRAGELNNRGCHEIVREHGSKRIPLFLSGFIPQGHMDTFAIERLRWHLRTVIQPK